MVPEVLEFQVEERLSPVRLDQFLASVLTQVHAGFSRSRVQKLIDDGQIKVDSQLAKASLKLSGGERVLVNLPEPIECGVKAQEIPLQVVYEDEHLLVVNKPTGLVVHPGAGVADGTLVNALLNHCRDSLSGISGTMRPGIVHRLDKDTSGLLVVAKNDVAHQNLSAQISARTAKRVYMALVEGTPPAERGTVDKPIGRHKSKRWQMAIVPDGRKAITHFEVLSTREKFSLIKATLQTGRTHQIRVHMASLNCPVVGDLVYNNKTTGTETARRKLGLNGQALHAAYLCFTHPISGQLLEFEAALPADFQQLIDRL
ncbi:MAG: RluA family pseudouridine synthase [Candidatus Obscuribacterales bacterium]|nr:RluA family pseudouridine synthase [Candidatus Obscuribacterales bacterium]